MTIVPPNNNQASLPQQQVANYKNQQLGGVLSGNPGTQVQPGSQSPGSSVLAGLNTGYNDAQQNATDALTAFQQQHQANQQQVDALNQQRAVREAQAQQQAIGSQQQAGGGSWGGSAQPDWQNVNSGGVMGASGHAVGGGYTHAEWGGNASLSKARNEALSKAFSYVGDRYVLGGTSHAGIDCSGLVMAVYDAFGYGKYVDSHNARIQGQSIPGVRTSVRNLVPGDIVAWNDGSHIAIYAGNGMIVAAASPGEGVKYQPVWGNVTGIHLTLPGE